MIGVDRLNQFMGANRPVGTCGTIRLKMHRCFRAEFCKRRLPGIVELQLRVAYVDGLQV